MLCFCQDFFLGDPITTNILPTIWGPSAAPVGIRPTAEWSIIGHFDKIPKKETQANKLEIVPFEYFDDDYIPTDVVSYIYSSIYTYNANVKLTQVFSLNVSKRVHIIHKNNHTIFLIKQHMIGQSPQNLCVGCFMLTYASDFVFHGPNNGVLL